MRWPWSKPKHRHEYQWVVESEGATWSVFTRCLTCDEVGWACSATSAVDLNRQLRLAFTRGELSSLGYFTAPTMVPA